MGETLFRFTIVWTLLHVILFFIEWYRYKHSSWSWHGFKNYGTLNITYCVLSVDIIIVTVAIIAVLGYWILEPIKDNII